MKIILLNNQNNYVENSMSNAAESFDIPATNWRFELFW